MTNSTQHTPELKRRLRGWYQDIADPCSIYDREHRLVCQTAGYGVVSKDGLNRYAEEEESRMQAALIAAAPDLLEALENFVTTLSEHGEIFPPDVRTARAAIAKATK